MAPHSKAETIADDFHRARLAIHVDLGAGRDVSPLFVAAAHPEALTGPAFCFPQPNFSAAAWKTARSRSFFRFFRRNSSGSIFNACASSSMYDSRAKWLAVAASARYDPCRSGERAG